MLKNLPANAGHVGSSPGSGRSPGEGKATHSSILAWIIPWIEEPGKLQSMGSQRVRHDLVIKSEKEMATHSSILAWIIPGTEEPGGLPHRVGYN